MAELETEIEKIEEEISRLQEELADPEIYDNYSEARRVTAEFNAANEKVKELYGAWERKASELDKV